MSIKKNFLYSSILTSAGYIFPLITFPYVSRVLGVTNIGICNFVDSIIYYFVLFSMMGIRTLGIREIARCQGNKTEMSKTFSSIIILNVVFAAVSGTVLLLSIHFVPQFAEHKELMYVGVVKLIALVAMIEWLYKGVEDFKYITLRSLIIRCLYVVLVFCLVRDKDDYPVYFSLLAVTEVFSAVINCVHARKYVCFTLKDINPFRFCKSTLILGCYTLLTSMYTSFNVAYLGFVSNTDEVGYYTTATKLHTIILALFTAFTGVMMPRMSNLLSQGKFAEFSEKIEASLSLLIYFAFPVMIFGICFAHEIVFIIAGSGYDRASLPLMIVMPLVFIIGFEQILVHQVLMPMKQDRAVLINSVLGASVGVVFNMLLVSHWEAVGSSLVWAISELAVMTAAICFVKKYHSFCGLPVKLLKNFLWSVPIIFLSFVIREIDLPTIIVVLLGIFCYLIYYAFLYICVVKDDRMIALIPYKRKKTSQV